MERNEILEKIYEKVLVRLEYGRKAAIIDEKFAYTFSDYDSDQLEREQNAVGEVLDEIDQVLEYLCDEMAKLEAKG